MTSVVATNVLAPPAPPSPCPSPSLLIPPVGNGVLLEEKTKPVCENPALIESKTPLCYTRAQLDVSRFKTYLRSLPASYWNDAEAAKSNVELKRPAHDAWGIKKIVFTFCDDFMQKVLELPYARDEKWRQFLLPIYESIGVTENRIIRSLLASIPPGVSIPVHHDTGISQTRLYYSISVSIKPSGSFEQ